MSFMPPVPQDVYTPEERAEYEKLSKDGVLTLFIYSKNYYFGGERIQIDENNVKIRTELRKGVMVSSVDVFKVFGKDISDAHNKTNYSIKPFEYLGHTYVPVKEFAENSGLSVTFAYKDRVAIIGCAEKISEINKALKLRENIGVAAADLVIGKYDAYKFISADYKEARDKWRRFLVGSPDTIDVNDPNTIGKLQEIEKHTEERLSSMNRGENIPILWGENPPSASNDLRLQYGYIRELAIAYGTYGTKFYKDENLKEAVHFAVKWMNENMYGDAELEGHGWRDINAFNWWDWYVAAPEALTDIILIMEDTLTKEQINKYLRLFKWLLENWRLEYNIDKSPSRVCTGAKYAIIAEDPERLEIASNDFHIMLEMVLKGEGTRPDYAYYCHGYPYSLIYGFMLTDRVLKVAINFAGTPLEYTSNRNYDQYMLIRYMYDAAMFKGRGFKCFTGRMSTAPDINVGYQAVAGILPMIGYFGPDEDAYLKNFIKYSMVSDEAKAEMKRRCSLPLYSILNDIFNDENVLSENTEKYAHAWFNSDRAVQHRTDYAFVVSMPSYRHFNYECINHANKSGWYMNDGALYLYTKTDPEEFSGENFVLNRRLAQRIPGTTVDSRDRELVSISEGWYPDNERVGCMDFDKEFVVAGMDYTSYNMAEFDETYVDTGYGGANPKFVNDLVAKKAYFMFDDECICLGAGINSTMGSDILTTVEHRRLINFKDNPYGDDKISVDGKLIEENTFENKYESPSYARVEGFAGFVFLDAKKVSVSKYMHAYDRKFAEFVMDDGYKPDASEEERPFVEIMINHGKNPTNASYAYAVLPYASEEKTKAYAENPDFEIISNTNEIQAVKEKTLGITGIVFYEAGECSGIKVNSPCIVTFKETDSEFKIKICEPTNKVDRLEIEIDRKLTLFSAHNRYDISCDERTFLSLNTERSLGEGYEAIFSI